MKRRRRRFKNELRYTKADRERERQGAAALAYLGQLYGLIPGDYILGEIDRIAREHERQAAAHTAAAALLREMLAAIHEGTTA